MRNLGLYLIPEKSEEKLVDLITGEILAEDNIEKWWYLQMLQYCGTEYTLQLI